MAISITINGSEFSLPSQGESAPWGEDLSNIIEALAQVANDTLGPSDILTTSFNLANNQAVAANVNGLSFNTSLVRSAIIKYSIYRSTTTNETSEVGHIYITYKTTPGTWEIAQNYAGSSGVTFTITNAGQVQFTSSNLAGAIYSGKMKFSATAFLQA